MDERAIKRLVIVLVASIIAIFVLKTMLLKTADRVGKAAAEKKQAALPRPAPGDQTPAPAPAVDAPTASGVNVPQ